MDYLELNNDLKAFLNNSLLGHYRTTPAGEILFANNALIKMLGFKSFDELKKRNLEQEGYEPDYPRHEFKKQLEQSGKVMGLESAWTTKHGSVLYVRESASMLRDEDDKIICYEGVVENITKEKQITDALEAERQRFE